MPLSGHPLPEIKVSFADVFKSSKTLREEAAAAALKRSLLEASNKEAEEAGPPPPPPKEPIPATEQKTEAKPAAPESGPGLAAKACPAEAATSTNSILEWTPEQDLQLLKMKAEYTPWRAISASIGKPVFALKDRWGVIQPKTSASRDKQKAQKEAKPTKLENEKTRERRVSFSEPIVTPDNDGARDADSSKKVLYLDEAFTLEDVILLNQIAARYDEDKWIRISSRFFDKTGKRLPPRILKKHVCVD
ncbi:hypothetical protein D8B26_006658 [Coccidioides posadasii str. Silveira]|uniref:Uncharacterized protein n=1 Tax=Coccidioides posadasii (strain RMSCC 757 / Silveira) TaxID=443226 RepID=E9CUL2_COCPS|nr:conserved hypothetical protein [Coccidioides posadasii str. Silveira]QVM12022.1 hypothetical protein D8B26_006658 [Coccidioides posadasii str. Silveira]